MPDYTTQTETPASAVKTGTYLHRPNHPVVNIGTKRTLFPDDPDRELIELGLVTPPTSRTKRSRFTMQYHTFPPDEILSVSKLP